MTTRTRREPKPWYRTRNLAIAALCLPFALVGLALWWGSTATPRDSFDLPAWVLAEREAHGERSPRVNAADLVPGAVDLYDTVLSGAVSRLENNGPPGGGGWGPTLIDEITSGVTLRQYNAPDDAVKEAIAVLAALKAAGLPDRIDAIANADVYHIPLADVSYRPWPSSAWDVRKLSTYLMTRMALASRRGDAEAMLAAADRTLRIAALLDARPEWIAHSIGTLLRRELVGELRHCLSDRAWDDETLRAIAALPLRRPPPSLDLMKRAVRYDVATARESLDQVYDRHGLFVQTAYDSMYTRRGRQRLVPPAAVNLIGLTAPRRWEVERALSAYERAVLRSDEVLVDYAANILPDMGEDALLIFEGRMQDVVWLVSPNTRAQFATRFDEQAAHVEALIAVQRYALRHGGPPADLERVIESPLAPGPDACDLLRRAVVIDDPASLGLDDHRPWVLVKNDLAAKTIKTMIDMGEATQLRSLEETDIINGLRDRYDH